MEATGYIFVLYYLDGIHCRWIISIHVNKTRQGLTGNSCVWNYLLFQKRRLGWKAKNDVEDHYLPPTTISFILLNKSFEIPSLCYTFAPTHTSSLARALFQMPWKWPVMKWSMKNFNSWMKAKIDVEHPNLPPPSLTSISFILYSKVLQSSSLWYSRL